MAGTKGSDSVKAAASTLLAQAGLLLRRSRRHPRPRRLPGQEGLRRSVSMRREGRGPEGSIEGGCQGGREAVKHGQGPPLMAAGGEKPRGLRRDNQAFPKDMRGGRVQEAAMRALAVGPPNLGQAGGRPKPPSGNVAPDSALRVTELRSQTPNNLMIHLPQPRRMAARVGRPLNSPPGKGRRSEGSNELVRRMADLDARIMREADVKFRREPPSNLGEGFHQEPYGAGDALHGRARHTSGEDPLGDNEHVRVKGRKPAQRKHALLDHHPRRGRCRRPCPQGPTQGPWRPVMRWGPRPQLSQPGRT